MFRKYGPKRVWKEAPKNPDRILHVKKFSFNSDALQTVEAVRILIVEIVVELATHLIAFRFRARNF